MEMRAGNHEQDVKPRHNPIPTAKVMKKVGYFFQPYSMNVGLTRHMDFADVPSASLHG